LKHFIKDFFDQNPISQLGLCVTKNSIAKKLTDLSGNPKNHEHSLSNLLKMDGLASLQNVLLFANGVLRTIPDYGHRELLVIYSSVKTTDPGDIFATIEEAVKLKIRINVICVAAEIFIARHMAERTGGSFAVALDATHLQELLMDLTIPPPELQQRGSLTTDFIYMGFPKRTFDAHPSFGFDGMQMVPFSTAYVCPRCHTRSSEIPRDCAVCRLQLSSSSHIARSHHHLFPVSNFVELSVIVNENGELVAHKVESSAAAEGDDVARTPGGGTVDAAAALVESESTLGGSPSDSLVRLVSSCTGCLGAFSSSSLVMQCPGCESMFCVECDLFIHNSLHNCPGCV
jgi:transcription initiation factor TFIIH subunit 2